jgi:hypothetical protein
MAVLDKEEPCDGVPVPVIVSDAVPLVVLVNVPLTVRLCDLVREPESVPLFEPDLEGVPLLEPDLVPDLVPDAVPELVGVRLGVEV